MKNLVQLIGSLILLGAAYTYAKPAKGMPLVTGRKVPRERARALAISLDQNAFGGWFQDPDHNIRHVLGIWSRESNFEPTAYNPNDPSGAWGIGQVLATTAAQHGYNDPNALFDPAIGAAASMEHLRWTWTDLTGRLGRQPTTREWIMAYNVGSRGVAIGRTANAYYLDVMARSIL